MIFPKPDYGFVNIGDPSGGDLNGYQRLLIHQLVQNEYPGYRSFPRGNQSFIQVEKINVKKEAQVCRITMLSFKACSIDRSERVAALAIHIN